MAILNKKLLLISGAITVVILAGILALFLFIKTITPRIEAAVSTALGMEVRIKGKASIALFPGFGLSLNNVSVRNKGLDVVKIEKMRIGLKLIALASFDIKVIEIGLVKPVCSIIRSNSGVFNLEGPKATLWEKLLAVQKISISQGSFVYTDETSSQTIEVDDLDLGIHHPAFRATNSAEAFKNISLTGDIRCKKLKIDDLTLINLALKAAGGKGVLDIDPVSVNIAGGTGNGSIQVDVTGPSPHYRIICHLKRVRVEDLLHLYAVRQIPQKTIEGMIDLSADLTAMGNSADELKRSLNGHLAFDGEDLMLYGIDIDALIAKYERSQNLNLVDVGAFLLAGPFGPVLTKGFNFAALHEESLGGKGVIRKIVSVWKIENGMAEALDVALASKKQRIAMQGGLNFINERFADVTVAALDKRGCAVYSEKVQGPFNKPHIEKESIFKSIAGSVLNPMQDAWKFIQGQECTVFYSGSVAHPEG